MLLRVMRRRILLNTLFTFLGVVICISVAWQLVSGPGPPMMSPLHYNIETPYSLHNARSLGYTYPRSSLSTNDYSQLIDIYNFTFNIITKACNTSSVLLLILVHSAPVNFGKRNTIRDTWGRPRDEVKVVFMIGAVQDQHLQSELEKENDKHGDIVQGSFMDAYRNMTYKHVMCLKYTVYHCPQAKYILKTDDDIYVNMPNTIDFLHKVLSPYGASNLLMCVVRRNVNAVRSYRLKWRVSLKEYPFKKYPTYCFGWVILYSPDVVFALYRESQNSEYFWIDDVHITGILVKKLPIVHTDLSHLVSYKQDTSNAKSLLFGGPDLSKDQIRKMTML